MDLLKVPDKEKMRKHWPDLMARAQAGDIAAYKELLNEITPILRRFMARKLFSQDILEDIVQETLLAVHTARHTYRPEDPFDRWLFGIARHKALDAMRRYYRQGVHEILVDTDETFSHLLANDKNEGIVQDIKQALDQLPEKQRKIVIMAKLEGHSLADIAVTYGMTEAAVRVTVHRAYKTMKLWLVNNGYE